MCVLHTSVRLCWVQIAQLEANPIKFIYHMCNLTAIGVLDV